MPRRLPRGWTEGSVQELLGLSDLEMAIVELRERLSSEVQRLRAEQDPGVLVRQEAAIGQDADPVVHGHAVEAGES